MSNDSNSSEIAIRMHAPQMLARAFEAARTALTDADKLRLKTAFVDSLLRYFFAVLAAENAGLGLSVPEGCKTLLNRFTTPSWGDWSKAFEALAQSVLGASALPIAPEFAQLLLDRTPDGTFTRREFFCDIIQIIDLRNTKLAHRIDGSVGYTDAEATNYLHDVVNPALQRICRELRVLVHRPLLYLADSKPTIDGELAMTVLRLVGLSSEPQRVVCPSVPALRPKVPFLLDASGNTLYLNPFVMVEGMSVSGQPAPRVIAGWDEKTRQPIYDTIDGSVRGTLNTPLEGMPQSPDALFKLKSRAFRHEAALDSELSTQLVAALRRRVPVDLPGLEIDEDKPLGKGASGVVYRARWSPGRQAPSEWVAVKVLHGDTLTEVQRRRLREEYEVLRRISHPCLPTVHDFREVPIPHFVMEKIAGSSLQARIQRRPLPLELVVEIALSVLDVLEVVHDHGVVHRDMKPSNIMLLDDDSAQGVAVKVIDFGIALTDPQLRFTGSLDFLGSQGFAAPEQFRKGEIDKRADIFALGRIIQASLIGDREDRIGTIPPGMQAIIHTATQQNPDYRFSSAMDMKAAINARKDGGWKGLPVQENSPLDENHDLLKQRHRIGDIYVLDAVETQTGRREAIALAAAPEARRKLLDAVSRQPEGSCTTQTTGPHSILFTTLPPDNEAERLERLLDGKNLWTARQTEKRRSQFPTTTAIEAPGELLPDSLQAKRKSGLLRRALLQRIGELKKLADEDSQESSASEICFEAFAAFESILLAFALHAARAETIDTDLWNSCPPMLGGILDWIHKLRLPYPGVEELLECLRRFTHIRNQLVHHAENQVSRQELSHAVVYSCILLANAVEATVPKSQRGDVAPFLTYDEHLKAWCLLRNRRGAEVREYFTLEWNPNPLDEHTAAQQGRSQRLGRNTKTTQENNTSLLTAYLTGRPYAHEVIQHARSQYSRRAPRGREADLAVYTNQQRVVLVAEVKVGQHDKLSRAHMEEQIWVTARAFEAPFAVLDHDGNRAWFAVESDKGLREMPDDAEIVARFAPASTGS